MQRIRLEVFKTFFKKDLTGNEIDFLIALSHVQDEKGEARGIFYRDMMRVVGMSTQAFYDCKRSLQEKGLIRVTRVQNDYDIELIGNDFTSYTDQDYKNGEVKYINTNTALFRDRNWKKLKPAQKLLAIDLVNISVASNYRTYRISRDKFIQKYTDLLRITERTLQKYMKLLKLYFYVGIKEGIYMITFRKQFGKKVDPSEHETTSRNILTAACRRNRIKDQDPKEFRDIIDLLGRYRKRLNSSFCDISFVVTKMLQVLNDRRPDPRKWQRRLKASLFHKILREEMGLA